MMKDETILGSRRISESYAIPIHIFSFAFN